MFQIKSHLQINCSNHQREREDTFFELLILYKFALWIIQIFAREASSSLVPGPSSPSSPFSTQSTTGDCKIEAKSKKCEAFLIFAYQVAYNNLVASNTIVSQ